MSVYKMWSTYHICRKRYTEVLIMQESQAGPLALDLQKPPSLATYAADLERSSDHIILGAPGSFWTVYRAPLQVRAVTRHPASYLAPPSAEEVRQTLRRTRAVVGAYAMEPDESHPANARLYMIADHTYAVEKLSPAMRRSVRRGLRELRIESLTAKQVLAYGAPAYIETRRRLGLNDATLEAFRKFVATRARARAQLHGRLEG